MKILKRIYRRIRWEIFLCVEQCRCLFEDYGIIRRFVYYEKHPNIMRKYAYLRACCHVMDKGMEVDNWEPGHGKSLYDAAIITRNQIKDVFEKDDAFKWVNSVINEYECAQKSQHVNRNRCNETLNSDISISEEEKKAFEKILKQRTSCRNFIKKDIPQDILENMVRLAIEAPVGCCRQTVRFYIIKDPDIIEKISEHVSGMTCFSTIPCIVMVYAFSAAYVVNDRRMQYIDASLAIENFVLAATAYNLGSTICNFSSAKKKDEQEVAKILHIDNTLSPVVAIALGYPSSVPRKPTRMNISHFVKYL